MHTTPGPPPANAESASSAPSSAIPGRGGEAFSLAALEFAAVRERLARNTSFSASHALALALEPCGEFQVAQRLQAETTEAARLPGLRPSLSFGGVHDIRPLAARAAVGGVLQPAELLDVATTARAARAWRRGLLPLLDDLPTLVDLAASLLDDHSGIPESIQEAIGDNAEVLDSASPALRRIRTELRGAQDRLVARLRELMASSAFRDVVQDPVVTQRAGRYVIPIRADARGQVQGIVHDQSASGATLFVEPLATVDMGNRWRTLVVEEQREIERILRALSAEVGSHADALTRSVDGLARLDLARAKAALADQQRATAPDLVPLPRAAGSLVLRLLEARHPLLPGSVVPVSLELGVDFHHLLITGPNTGGKTVALKTAGLLTLMAQAGLHLPALEGSIVGVFRRVQADIGDEQSLQQSLSTFSSHVTRIVGMLRHADSCSLVLLDELGAGTDPQEGAALARAILTHLHARGAYVVATTHYPELKAYAHLTPRVQNASVEFDLRTLSPTYRLLVGTPGRSNAFAIAERLGMPGDILDAARTNVAPRTAEVETLLAEIAQERAEAQRARERIDLDREAAKRMMREARTALRDAERRRKEVWEQARTQADTELAELRREAHRLRQHLQSRGEQRPAARDAVAAALALPSISAPPSAEPDVPEPEEAAILQTGAEVLVPRLGLPGRVLSVRDGTVELEVLGRRVRLAVAELEGTRRPTSAERRAAAPARSAPPIVVTGPRGDVPFQLDLRGLRRDEALERLEEYLSDAAQSGLPSARIVHGKGTGAIRQAVRDTLRGNPYVDRYAPEPDAAGGDGATLIWFSG